MIGLGLGSGLGLVVFSRSRLCLFHDSDSRLLLEMASTVHESENSYVIGEGRGYHFLVSIVLSDTTLTFMVTKKYRHYVYYLQSLQD